MNAVSGQTAAEGTVRPQDPPPRKHRRFGRVVVVLLSGAALFGGFRALAQWLTFPRSVQAADAIVVLGGGGADRLRHGAALYAQGVAPEIWCTGGEAPTEPSDVILPVSVVRLVVGSGVPEDAIRILPSASTWEDAAAVRQIADDTGARKLLIVTSWYHGRRAMRVMQQRFQGTNVELLFDPAVSRGFSASNWWRDERGRKLVMAEISKSAFYTWRYGLPPW